MNIKKMRIKKANSKKLTRNLIIISILVFITFFCLSIYNPQLISKLTSFVASGVGYGYGEVPITSCMSITSPGTYKLTQDISGNQANGFCIYIQTDNVILDCQGYSISGSDLPGTRGIYVEGRTDVTIENCNVKDYQSGIYLESTSNSIITNNNLDSNVDNGIILSNSKNNEITNNIVTSTGENGIYLAAFSNGNTITGNTATSNKYGIYVTNSTGNIVTGNTADSNTNGLVLFYHANSNTMSDNTADSNTRGIAIGYYSNNNILTNNIVTSNTQYGVYAYSSSNNDISSSLFNNINNIHLEDSSPNTWNENMYLTPSGTGFSENAVLCNPDLDGFCQNPYDILGDESNVDYRPLSNIGRVCANITTPGTYTLIQDISGNQASGVCIEIQSSDVILDCQGYSITATGNAMGISLYNRNNIIIENCNIDGYTIGIYNWMTSNSLITNNNVINSNNGGIYFDESLNNNITNNIVTSSKNGILLLSGSHNNNVINNDVSSNSAGVQIAYDSNSNNVINNIASNNEYGILVISDDSNNNLVANNIVDSSLYAGIYSINNNTITNNIISNTKIFGGLIVGSYNSIYNNILNNTNNVWSITTPNDWNTTKTAGTNIAGGSYIAGNYWANPTGTGFSEDSSLCGAIINGICQNAYDIFGDGINVDYLPLANLVSEPCIDADHDGYNASTIGYGYGADCGPIDCNDNDASINPGADDSNCNGIDENCDGVADDGYVATPTTCGTDMCSNIGTLSCIGGSVSDTCVPNSPVDVYRDADSDNYGDSGDTQSVCTMPEGYILNNGDCDDTDASINPGANDICDASHNVINKNCNPSDDQNLDCTDFCGDTDSDGYVTEEKWNAWGGIIPSIVCPWVVAKGDCNDLDAAVNPTAAEICDGVDNNCNGIIDEGCPSVDKQDALSMLNLLSPSKQVNEAIKEIKASLGNTIIDGDKKIVWIDTTNVACRHGEKVFDHEKKAVENLEKVSDPQAAQVINMIVQADRNLALTAINEASAGKDKDKAMEKFNKGEAETRAKQKIQKYREAWKHVNKDCEKKGKVSCINEMTVQSPSGDTVTAIGDEIDTPDTVFTDIYNNIVAIKTDCKKCIKVGDVVKGWTITDIVDDGTLAAVCAKK